MLRAITIKPIKEIKPHDFFLVLLDSQLAGTGVSLDWPGSELGKEVSGRDGIKFLVVSAADIEAATKILVESECFSLDVVTAAFAPENRWAGQSPSPSP